ncbi:MAG: HepT-like ribonuclease domain-containing protein [Microcystaceae cyanobacterium]
MSSDQEIILDLYHALNQILTFTQNMDKQEFINDEKTQSSVLYQLVIMGESVNRLSEQFKKQYPQIPFNEIQGMRNRVVHEYKEVDCDIIWEAIQKDIPELIDFIASVNESD